MLNGLPTGLLGFGPLRPEGSRRRQVGRLLGDERGQALAEFIMLIPLILALVWYLVHVSVAINKSIVGQKHARSQLFLKMYNHRSGPVQSEFGNTERSHFYMGISSNVQEVGANNQPTAPTETLGLGANPKVRPDANDEPGEAGLGTLRQKVRIRTAFGICTHRKRLPDGSGLTDYCGSRPGR